MIRTTSLAALTLALMSAAAVAQPADQDGPNGPPAQLSNPNANSGPPPNAQDYGPPANAQNYGPPPNAQDQRSRDMFCRRDAAARTGYVTPDQAASHEQTNGTVLGTLGGAALGAAIGGAAGNAGAGAAIGAGAGLIGGTAVGADNARRAANDVEQNYAAAYYACMGEANGGPGDANYAYGPPPGGAYGPPPPYYGYGAYPYPYYPYYGPGYYGPGISFGFGFGGYHGRHWR